MRELGGRDAGVRISSRAVAAKVQVERPSAQSRGGVADPKSLQRSAGNRAVRELLHSRGGNFAAPRASRQRAFGRHDLRGVQAHADRARASAAGAEAFTSGEHVVFRRPPSACAPPRTRRRTCGSAARNGVSLPGSSGNARRIATSSTPTPSPIASRSGGSVEPLLDSCPARPARRRWFSAASGWARAETAVDATDDAFADAAAAIRTLCRGKKRQASFLEDPPKPGALQGHPRQGGAMCRGGRPGDPRGLGGVDRRRRRRRSHRSRTGGAAVAAAAAEVALRQQAATSGRAKRRASKIKLISTRCGACSRRRRGRSTKRISTRKRETSWFRDCLRYSVRPASPPPNSTWRAVRSRSSGSSFTRPAPPSLKPAMSSTARMRGPSAPSRTRSCSAAICRPNTGRCSPTWWPRWRSRPSPRATMIPRR